MIREFAETLDGGIMSRRGENIRKRKDGRWEGRIRDLSTEETKYKSIYGKTYSEVKRRITAYLREHETTSSKLSSFTFGELLDSWQIINRVKNKGSTELKYENLIEKHIRPSLGSLKLNELNADILTEYIRYLLTDGRLDGSGGLSSSYVRTISVIIQSALKIGEDKGLCKGISIKRVIPRTVIYAPKTLSKSDCRMLEDYLFSNPNPTNAGILLSLRTGLRVGEVCALKWSNIDQELKVLSVCSTVIRSKKPDEKIGFMTAIPKTKASVRDIPLTEDICQYLQLLRPYDNTVFLLSGEDYFMLPSTYNYRYHRVLKQLSIPDINYHALRHTFATRCIESGMDDKSLSEILGHANVSITLNTYVHSSMELKKAQLEKLSRYFQEEFLVKSVVN